MADVNDTPIVLGLYRHDVPEEETLRAVLQWLRDRSVLYSAVSHKTSIEESKDILRQLHQEEALGKMEPLLLPGVFAFPSIAEESIRRLDDVLIDQVVSSNDRLPQRVVLLTQHVGYFPLLVGYADAVPDDPRTDGRRMAMIATTASAWTMPRIRFATWMLEPTPPKERAAYLLSEMRGLLAACSKNLYFDYASIQHGRDLPTPPELLRSDDPRDFDRLYLGMPTIPSETARKLGAHSARTAEWSLERLGGGVFITRDAERDPSDEGARFLDRLRAILRERLRGLV